MVKTLKIIEKMIRLAIKGQIGDDTKLGYTYPDKFNPALSTSDDDWLHSVTDPRDARNFDTEKVYAVWKSEQGNYYAIIVPSKYDTRNGRLMITLFTGRKIFSNGKIVIETLNTIRNIVDGKWSDDHKSLNIQNEDIQKHILDAESFLSNGYNTVSQDKTNTKVYRTYSNESELENFLKFPNQPEYNQYKRILFVPQDCIAKSPQVTANFREITGQIKVIYDISKPLPNGVRLSKSSYNFGESVLVTYHKDGGYIDVSKSFIADGRDSKYAQYAGTEIIINGPEAAEILFERKIKFDIKSKSGKQISSNFRCEGLNCCPKQNNDNSLIFSSSQAEPLVKISCPGYEAEDITITNNDFISGSKTVRLEPKLNTYRIRIEDKSGRTRQGEVRVYSDNELDDIFKEADYYGKKLYVIQKIVQQGGGQPGGGRSGGHERGPEPPTRRPKKKNPIWGWVKAILITFVVLYALYALYCWSESTVPFPFKPTTEEPDFIVNDTIFEGEEVESTEIEKNTLEYMKSEDVWERSKIEEYPKYATLLDFIYNGQIDEAINHTYSTQEGINTNGYWKTGKSAFVDIVQELKSKSDYENRIKPEIADAMRRNSKPDQVDIKKLSEEVVVIRNKYTNDVETFTPRSEIDKKPAPKESKKTESKGVSNNKKPANSGAKKAESGRPTSDNG